MKNSHVYEYDFDLDSDVAPARVLRMVKPGSRVLEVGAGPGSITKHLVTKLGCSVVALEVDPSAIEILQSYVQKIYPLDLNVFSWSDVIRCDEGTFDYVIAADVLEHVYDPSIVLQEMKSLLSQNGAIILSIPNVGHASVAACLVDEDFEYWSWGLLDRTHIRFFGIKNIQALINGAGLTIEKAEFVIRSPLMTEFAARWKRMPPDIQSALQRNRFSQVLQVVTLSRKALKSVSGIDLIDLTPTLPAPKEEEYWTRIMAMQSNDRNTDTRNTFTLQSEHRLGHRLTRYLTRIKAKLRGKRSDD